MDSFHGCDSKRARTTLSGITYGDEIDFDTCTITSMVRQNLFMVLDFGISLYTDQ